jgi:hypothetical protein
MKEFHIAWDSRQLTSLKNLYNEVLKIDHKWHFFYEGPVLFLRVSKGNAPYIEKWLQERKVQFTLKGNYEENIPTSKKYLEEFIQLFHLFSVLAMKIEDGDLHHVAERVFHCFLNTMRRPEEIKKLEPFAAFASPADLWEPMMLAYHALERSRTIGFILGLMEGEK